MQKKKKKSSIVGYNKQNQRAEVRGKVHTHGAVLCVVVAFVLTPVHATR